MSLPLPLPSHPQALLIDLAGVLHVGDRVLPGAVPALGALRAAGLKLVFMTNTTRTPRRTLNRPGFCGGSNS